MVEQLAKLYVAQIVHYHGISKSIISNCDGRFTSKFWKSVHQVMSTKAYIQYSFPPTEEWTIWKDHPNSRGYAMSMHHGLQKNVGHEASFDQVPIQQQLSRFDWNGSLRSSIREEV